MRVKDVLGGTAGVLESGSLDSAENGSYKAGNFFFVVLCSVCTAAGGLMYSVYGRGL